MQVGVPSANSPQCASPRPSGPPYAAGFRAGVPWGHEVGCRASRLGVAAAGIGSVGVKPATMPTLSGHHYRTGLPVRVTWEGESVRRVDAVAAGACADGVQIAPALLDIQLNGYAGLDFSRPDGLERIAAQLAALGTARFCPTVVTGSPEAMAGTLRTLAAALAADGGLRAAVPGIHLEGPFISGLDGPRGAHPAAWVRDPDWDTFQRLQEAARGAIRLVTLAPERPGAEAFTARATAAGVRVAIGHTAADAGAIERAVGAGARLSTHLGNGLAARIDRHANPLWPQLARAELYASFIADGHHLPAPALVAMMRAKGEERCILVSDAVAQAGLPPGRYTGIGGDLVDVGADGRVTLAGTPYLAGSGFHLARCVAHAARVATGLPAAVEMASLHPARLMSVAPGGLEPGAAAHLWAFRLGGDGEPQTQATVRGGRVVYGAPGGS